MKALTRAQLSLEGLSVGDAFGQTFFVSETEIEDRLAGQKTLLSPWPFTDDTQMALSVCHVLRCFGRIEPNALAQNFADHYDPSRGYGPAMHRLLQNPAFPQDWSRLASNQFGGQGSWGNGSAMRVAPIGAFFAEDLEAVVEQATVSSLVTHSHPEAVAGAIAVAIAAALAWREREVQPRCAPADFLTGIMEFVPVSEVRSRISRARDIETATSLPFAVAVLGNGIQLSAPDTVPFALWCAAQHLDDFAAALWLAVNGLGDRDTISAMVGSIVALSTGLEGIPPFWRQAREALPAWPFETF
ncbi:MAG: ADP-ribosylglycohydrolase family protein [Blastocatellia bacterium]|nr:ADP-ribosylglycohydrolase family protein [Blastocatellia bacterium]